MVFLHFLTCIWPSGFLGKFRLKDLGFGVLRGLGVRLGFWAGRLWVVFFFCVGHD